MQNIFITTIRFGAVAVLAFTVFANEAFAAPVLTPSSATAISETTATVIGKVANPGYKSTTVWFEWGETPNSTTVEGMRDVFSDGFFQGHLSNLKPGTTYYVRAVATEGGVTTYSPVVTFTTRGGAASAPAANTVQTATVSVGGTVSSVNTAPVAVVPVASAPAPAQASAPVSKTKTAPVEKSTTEKTNTARNNTAAVSNTSGVLPGTLIGWVALLIALLIVFLIFAMIVDSVEERRKAREEAKKKKLEREAEVE